jgi:hypothetical protein
MMSDDDGSLPQTEDISWTLRITDIAVSEYMSALERNGLVTRYVTGNVTVWKLHDWDVHQRKSDHDESGAERQRKWREAHKAQKTADHVTVVDRNALRNGPVTLPDTDTDTEKKVRVEARDEVRVALNPEIIPLKKTASAPKGSRWPSEAVVPEDWIGEGALYRAKQGYPQIDLRTEALKFANYWASKSGGGATKIDWKKTWLNWCITAKGNLNGSGLGKKSQLEQLYEFVADQKVGGTVLDD